MNARQLIARAIGYRADVGRFGLDTVQREELVDAVFEALTTSEDVCLVDPAPDDDDGAVIVFSGGIPCAAFPLTPLATPNNPGVPVWTALYDPALRDELVVLQLPSWLVPVRRRLARIGRRS